MIEKLHYRWREKKKSGNSKKKIMKLKYVFGAQCIPAKIGFDVACFDVLTRTHTHTCVHTKTICMLICMDICVHIKLCAIVCIFVLSQYLPLLITVLGTLKSADF